MLRDAQQKGETWRWGCIIVPTICTNTLRNKDCQHFYHQILTGKNMLGSVLSKNPRHSLYL